MEIHTHTDETALEERPAVTRLRRARALQAAMAPAATAAQAADSVRVLAIHEGAFWLLVAEAVARSLPEEVVEAKVAEAIRERIGRLTLAQAMEHLGCANETQLKAFCRQHGIPIRHYTAKKRYILLSDIEAIDAAKAVAVAAPDGQTTVVGRVGERGEGTLLKQEPSGARQPAAGCPEGPRGSAEQPRNPGKEEGRVG